MFLFGQRCLCVPNGVSHVPQEQGKDLDRRSMDLAGEPSWIRSNLQIHTHGSTMTAHDWLQVVSCAGDYVFAGLFPGDPVKQQALSRLVAVVRKILNVTSDADDDDRDQIDVLKLETIEALVWCERALPKTELAVMFHILVHVPDMMYRWNRSANFWCFWGER